MPGKRRTDLCCCYSMQGILNKYDAGTWGLAGSHGKGPIETRVPPSGWQILKQKVPGAAKVTVKDGQLWSFMFSGGKFISSGPKEECPERDSEEQKKGKERKQGLKHRRCCGQRDRPAGLGEGVLSCGP